MMSREQMMQEQDRARSYLAQFITAVHPTERYQPDGVERANALQDIIDYVMIAGAFRFCKPSDADDRVMLCKQFSDGSHLGTFAVFDYVGSAALKDDALELRLSHDFRRYAPDLNAALDRYDEKYGKSSILIVE